jgi:hypothetical protein
LWEEARIDILWGKSVCGSGDANLYVGQTFETKEELQSAVKLYSILQHREFVVSKSNKMLYTVVCKLKAERYGCSWRLYACKNKWDVFEIKKNYRTTDKSLIVHILYHIHIWYCTIICVNILFIWIIITTWMLILLMIYLCEFRCNLDGA